MNDSVSDGAIPDGRWAFAQADKATFTTLQNSFGYMRGPWYAHNTINTSDAYNTN